MKSATTRSLSAWMMVLLLALHLLVQGCQNRLASRDPNGTPSDKREQQVDDQANDPKTVKDEPVFENRPLSHWISQLASEDADARKEALRAIGGIGPRAAIAVPVVRKLLHDPDPDVQEWACAALGRIGPAAKDAVPELEKIILNQRAVDKVRWAAAVALGNIGPDAVAATPTLLKALQDPDPWLRWAATEGLAGIGPQAKGAAAALASALYDSEYIVRIGAARALVHLAPQIPPKGEPLLSLIRCYQDNSQYDSVRQKVAEAIKAVDPKVAAKLGIK
jgi:HEAT repeat protein